MLEEEMDNQESLKTEEEQVTLEPETEETGDGINWKERAEKAEQLANNQKIRAEKAERLVKKPAEKPEPASEVALSPKDYLALTENKVSSDDFDEVMRLSKILNKSVSETLKDKTTKVILAQLAEERASAQAANVGTSRRGTKTPSNNDILEKFDKGVVSEKDEDIEALAQAQLARRKAAAKR